MPPLPVNHQITPAEQLALSDQDVHLLYQIVTRAERHPGVDRHTFRALFREYHAVLSENGIEPELDQICLRFLFLLGKHLRGESLYTRFESLLLHMGIQISTDPTIHGNGLSYIEPESKMEADFEPYEPQQLPNGTSVHKRRQRRASFNSMYDAPTETTHHSIPRPPSRSSVSRLNLETGGVAAQPRRRRVSLSGAEDINSFYPNSELPRVNGSHNAHPEQYLPGDAGHRFTEYEQLAYHQQRVPDYDEEFAVESDISDHHIPKAPLPSELFYHPSLTSLLQDASVFNWYRERKIARHLLIQWLEQTRQRQQFVEAMLQVAVNRDRGTLLRQAFDEWRSGLEQKRREANTERFFKHLEARAVRARDLYLLTKAFTHWAKVTSDEIEKTNAARRHILGIKYFNAWKEVTAVNELKIQRLTVKRPFVSWSSRLEQIQKNEAIADQFYHASLIKRTYWRWFWSFCYRRAPQRAEQRLKKRSLISWLRAFRTHRERDNEIDFKRKHELLHSALQIWSLKARSVAAAQQSADNWRLDRLVRDSFIEWRIQHNLGAATARVTKMINTRIVRFSFDIWTYKAYMERLARDSDRQRVMYNAWTIWNDKLRCRALSMRIDARIMIQALYKWVLMERLRFMSRVRERRLKSTMLTKLMDNSSVLYTELLRREGELRDHRKRDLSQTIFHHWREKLALQRQRERIALAFYAPRVEHEALIHWNSRRDHLVKLETWAKNARYFFLTTTSLKRWRAIAQQASKKRKQDAYAAIRRRVKINLVSEALATWRSRLSAAADLDSRATEVYQQKLSKKAADHFDRWHSETMSRLKQISDADVFYNRQLTYNHLSHWVGFCRSYQAQEEKAARFLEIHVSSVALAHLKKLSLRVFQIRTDYEKADAANDRILRKHLRNMLYHWSQRARGPGTIRQNATRHVTTPAPHYGSQFYDGADDWHNPESTLRISDLGPDADLTSHTPATPGYLASPSKRAARARSLYEISTTPATPAITPFAVRLMAAREAPRSLPGRKILYARSPLATSVRFAIDEESEPESPTEGRSTNSRKPS
ncbi:hypothetical protein D8B26_002960 [Coccidioides posadasii str. Silveira]|uniref:Uncharacterized protein n=2 Tax=Coccidioides posadasii TaxID=199306 RepID=E9CXN9_COCPS|nr:conserved hypothetical protein [Coccidioides posadasii str. Silveira]KMM72726.1 hypothetical protein CPAG_09019 [Coccidioides posadasii RMSCC 3488]QVM08267.1 hypothetical protein D8B26_002960 [Coccidioides posadasii str. Silveira]